MEVFAYDPARARRLLAAAGDPNGFEVGDLTRALPFLTMGEAVGNYLAAVGIRSKLRTKERAAFLAAWREKKQKGLILTPSGALGNAATRLEPYVISTGAFASGGYPDIDEIFQKQAVERERGKRETLLHQIQRLMYEWVMHAPIYEPAQASSLAMIRPGRSQAACRVPKG